MDGDAFYAHIFERYFSMTKDILRKHSHVSSFGAIQRDCEDTVRRLQEKLQEEVDSPVSYGVIELFAAAAAVCVSAVFAVVLCQRSQSPACLPQMEQHPER